MQVATLVTLIALLLGAVPFTNWADMRIAAGRLRDTDLARAMTAPDLFDYQKRLSAVREATGGSAVTISALTIQVAGELSKESERDVMCLSVLDAAASISETRARSDMSAPLVDQFAVVRDRLQEMYFKQGGPPQTQKRPPVKTRPENT